MLFNGESNSVDKDFDIFSPLGWQFNNIESPLDTNVGNSAEDNTEFNFCHMQSRTLKSGRGMNSSVVYTVADKTECSVHFKPHPDSNDSGFITGNENSIKYFSDRIYAATGTSVQCKSNVLTAFGRPTAISIGGFLTNYFDVQYKLWLKGSTEPPTYKTYTLVNIQNDYDAQGLSLATDSYFRVKFEKISNPIETGYLTDISFIAPCDSTYLWQTEPEPVTISLPNIIDDTRIVVINYSKSTIVDDIVVVPSLIDNSVVSGGGGYSFSIGLDATNEVGDIILIKANWQSGTQAKLPLRIFAVMTPIGIELIDSQEDDLIHNNMIIDGVVGFDGSLADSSNGGELTANFTDVEINVNDADDRFDCQKGIAWWRWINTTELGALYYDALGLAYVPDERNIEIRGRLKLKNSKPNSELVIFGGVWKHYQGEAIITTGATNASIQWVPNDRLYNSNSQQITQIAQTVSTIPTNPVLTTDNRLDYLDANVSDAGVSEGGLHTALDSYSNKDSYKANPPSVVDIQNGLSLETTSQSIKSDTELMVKYHDNNTRYIGQDGVTVVSTKEGAYFIATYDNDGITELKRVAIKDADGNPINLGENAAGYDKV